MPDAAYQALDQITHDNDSSTASPSADCCHRRDGNRKVAGMSIKLLTDIDTTC